MSPEYLYVKDETLVVECDLPGVTLDELDVHVLPQALILPSVPGAPEELGHGRALLL